MIFSVRAQVVSAVMAALSDEDGPAGVSVFRARTEQFAREDCPAYNVWPVNEKYSYEDAGHDSVRVTLTVRVQCLVYAVSEVDVAVDSLAVFAHQAIMSDETLGGVAAEAPLTSSKWAIAAAGDDVCALDLDFDVQYTVSRTDPTVNTFFLSA